MAEENSAQLGISLPRYDGPFDLLLTLIRRHEYPINALPILEITSQFLAYVKNAWDLMPSWAGSLWKWPPGWYCSNRAACSRPGMTKAQLRAMSCCALRGGAGVGGRQDPHSPRRTLGRAPGLGGGARLPVV